MKSAVVVLSITILMAGAAVGQVHIKDSLVITPKQAKIVQDIPVPVVTASPSEISPGDIDTITVQWSEPDIMSVYSFEAGIASGEDYGTLAPFYFTWADTGKYLLLGAASGFIGSIKFQIWFLSYPDIDMNSDSVNVEIRVGVASIGTWDSAHHGRKGNAVQKESETSKAPTMGLSCQGAGVPKVKVASSIVDSFKYNTYGVAWVKVKKKEHTILLGETQYYEAMPDQNDPSKLDFKELSDPTQADPDRANAQFSVQNESGDKLGVYWEYPKDNNGNIIPGLIRLVGRYWQDGTTYKVGLSATSGSASGSIDIEVKKPSSLGSSNSTANDVHGNPYALDDSIITYAGREGVLPQYIKGMIQKETNFKPSYRYEPFLDLWEVQTQDGDGNYVFKPRTPYWIDDNSHMGNPGIPTDHSNLYDGLGNKTGYPTTCQSIWDIYQADMSNSKSLYSNAVYGNTYGMQDQWAYFYKINSIKLFNKNPEDLTANEQKVISDATDARFMDWMKNDFCGGMKGSVAQTRISASYGLVQLVYYYAAGSSEYPIDSGHRPEDINLVPYALKYGILHFENELKTATNGNFTGNEWPGGLENCYAKALGINNGAPGYVPDIVQYSGQYPPK